MDLQRPPHTTALTKYLLYASCLVPRCQESSLKVREHPKPENTKKPMQPPEQAMRPLLHYLPAQPCCLPHTPSPNPVGTGNTYCAPGTIPSTLRVLTHQTPKPHGNLLERENYFGPDSHMVSIPISSCAVKLT